MKFHARQLILFLSFLLFCACLPLSLLLSATGAEAAVPAGGDHPDAGTAGGDAAIPGPLRSFLRMAGISQKVSPEEVLPLLGRNVFLQGYDDGRPTEFLILLNRYIHQARELRTLAGPTGILRVSNCQDAGALLRVLGYRVRQTCGQKDASLITDNAERAFLTIDSGFPLPQLEKTLQGGPPFVYPFPSSYVPVILSEHDWVASQEKSKGSNDLLDLLTHSRDEARLYWALSRNDAETRGVLLRTVGLRKLLPFAPVLDFYGSLICIRSGHVQIPGGSAAEPVWKDLVGASPNAPGEFVPRLLAKDKGWLAAYFDALSRINETQQQHFTQSDRLKYFYTGLRSANASPYAARLAFRPAPWLLLLVTRLQWDPNGDPHVPGNLQTWSDLFRRRVESKIATRLMRRFNRWQHPDDFIQMMFALSRVETDTGLLQAYIFLNELDARRSLSTQLSPRTVTLLADKFAEFSNQYLIFSEFPDLSDPSIAKFLTVAESLGRIPNHTLRGNAMGTFQAEVGIWQILARQRQIPSAQLNDSWLALMGNFASIASSPQLFDAGCKSLAELARSAGGDMSDSQGQMIALLAGPRQYTPEGRQVHQEMANRIRLVLSGQRLISLDTLTSLGDGLQKLANGGPTPVNLLPLAMELRSFEMPQAIFTGSERNEWAAGTYNNRHTELQMRTDFTKVLRARPSKAQLQEARGELAPFLRDTLVGLNYAYYEPPGAQVLHHNPLFVRSHDFSGDTVIGINDVWQAPQLFGAGSPAGGGAHLIGSLADLPYALAEIEQEFIAPENIQALIWRELVAGLLTDATLPRWWNVTRNEMHAVALYQRTGEELIQASASNPELRGKVLNILRDRMYPRKLALIENSIRNGEASEVISQMTPADAFYLTAEFRRSFPDDVRSFGPAGQELENMSHQYPNEVAWQRLSQDFGVPHPILAQTYARELLNVKPFPAFEGYSSRLLAECWDSNNLYWARLADEMGYAPPVLNALVPQLTRRMVEKIFASEFEDWSAINRALHEAGSEFRQGKIAFATQVAAVSRP